MIQSKRRKKVDASRTAISSCAECGNICVGELCNDCLSGSFFDGMKLKAVVQHSSVYVCDCNNNNEVLGTLFVEPSSDEYVRRIDAIVAFQHPHDEDSIILEVLKGPEVSTNSEPDWLEQTLIRGKKHFLIAIIRAGFLPNIRAQDVLNLGNVDPRAATYYTIPYGLILQIRDRVKRDY